ncbi:MAG: hypothetical protein WBR30_13425, partial [Candidatus Sulfotelmatobacter sp.]
MSRLFSQLVAVMVLGTVVAASAGAMCVVPAAHAPMIGCHHPMQVPLGPHPADYRCCMSRYAVPLVTNAVSPRPALDGLPLVATPLLAAASNDSVFISTILPSSGPPGVFVL